MWIKLKVIKFSFIWSCHEMKILRCQDIKKESFHSLERKISTKRFHRKIELSPFQPCDVFRRHSMWREVQGQEDNRISAGKCRNTVAIFRARFVINRTTIIEPPLSADKRDHWVTMIDTSKWNAKCKNCKMSSRMVNCRVLSLHC